jgi:hypothetical protein
LALSQIKGIACHPAKGLLVEDFFGQGGDQGFATEFFAVALSGLLKDVVNVHIS